MSVQGYGWNSHWEKVYRNATGSNGSPGRIISTQHGQGRIWTGSELRNAIIRTDEQAVAGDWVLWRETAEGDVVVEEIMPRKSTICRKAAGNVSRPQILAVNVDRVLIVSSLNEDLNAGRLERYLATTWNCGASPVLVLTKPDLCDDLDEALSDVEEIAPSVPIHVVNPLTGEGLDELAPYLKEGMTSVLTGSSGVGKSTLINAVIGEDVGATQEIRSADGKGRHTTTDRVLFSLPGGGVLIDTPGIRELGLWVDETALKPVFQDLEAFADACRFRNCRHEKEPGCAVVAAVENGDLNRRRYQNYLKLRHEAESLVLREEPHRARARDKVLHKAIRKSQQDKYGRY